MLYSLAHLTNWFWTRDQDLKFNPRKTSIAVYIEFYFYVILLFDEYNYQNVFVIKFTFILCIQGNTWKYSMLQFLLKNEIYN